MSTRWHESPALRMCARRALIVLAVRMAARAESRRAEVRECEEPLLACRRRGFAWRMHRVSCRAHDPCGNRARDSRNASYLRAKSGMGANACDARRCRGRESAKADFARLLQRFQSPR